MIPKRRFAFKAVNNLVDLYLEGKKVINHHRGQTGNYYFRIPEDVEIELQVAEHDPSIPIEAEITPSGLKPIERRPRFVEPQPHVDLDEFELKRQQEADAEQALLKATPEASKEAVKD